MNEKMRTGADYKQSRANKLASLEYFYLEHLTENRGSMTDFDHAVLNSIQAVKERFCSTPIKE